MLRHAIDVARRTIRWSRQRRISSFSPRRCMQTRTWSMRSAATVSGQAIVTDVGSTKRSIVERARRLPPRLTSRRRSPARRCAARRGSGTHGRTCSTGARGCSRAEDDASGGGGRQAAAIRRGARRAAARDVAGGARPVAGVPEPPAAAHRQRADACRRQRGEERWSGADGPRACRYDPTGVESSRDLARHLLEQRGRAGQGARHSDRRVAAIARSPRFQRSESSRVFDSRRDMGARYWWTGSAVSAAG